MNYMDLMFYITCGVQLQVENLQPSFQGSARYRNTWEGLTTTIHNQGWRQLFAGLSINYIKVIVDSYFIHALSGFQIDAFQDFVF